MFPGFGKRASYRLMLLRAAAGRFSFNISAVIGTEVGDMDGDYDDYATATIKFTAPSVPSILSFNGVRSSRDHSQGQRHEWQHGAQAG